MVKKNLSNSMKKDKNIDQKKKNLPVRLPIELHRKLKIYAANKGKSMLEIIIEQIEKLPLDEK